MTVHGELPAIVPEGLDEEDIALRAALAEMQAIVFRHLQKLNLAITDLTTESQQLLVDHTKPYLDFELANSEGIWHGMPIMAQGPGGILVADADGNMRAAQHMEEDDVVTGFVDDVSGFPVPTLACMRSPDEITQDIPTYDQSFSAVVTLRGAQFTALASDGTPTVHDLSWYTVVLPLVYGMDIRVAPMLEL